MRVWPRAGRCRGRSQPSRWPPGDQLQRRFDHIHCSGSSRTHASNCFCISAMIHRTSSDGLSVRGTRSSLISMRKRLDVPIRWRGAGEWPAIRESAREMADTYEVVFATERGARHSSHYGGRAVDLTALALPRRLTLVDPGGSTQVFDLSGIDEPLDLSLTPVLIEWIEAHFGLRKLRSDYPHWDDAAPVDPPASRRVPDR